MAELRRIYLRARERRARATRAARAARAARAGRAFRRAAAERRLALAQEQASRRRLAAVRRARLQRRREAYRARLADPRLSDASLPRARRACLRYRRDSEPYAFGLGTQDPAGQVSGLLAVRAALGRWLAHAAVDQIDRRKLSALLGALRDGDGPLRRLRAVRELDDVLAARARYARVGRRAGRLATRLGLPDCAR